MKLRNVLVFLSVFCVVCGWSFFLFSGIPQKRIRYKITIVHAKIRPLKSDYMTWDTGLGATQAPDPYVWMEVGKKQYKTKVIRNTFEPVWNQSWVFYLPAKQKSLVLAVMDKDLRLDDLIGMGEVNLRQAQNVLFFGQVEKLVVRVENLSVPTSRAVIKKL